MFEKELIIDGRGHLEEKRKAKSAAFYALKTKKEAARTKAAGDKSVAAFNTELAKLGY